MSFTTVSKEDKAVQRELADGEIERLCELAVPDLAAAILPALAARRRPASTRPAQDVAAWLTYGWPRRPSFTGLAALEAVACEAIQALEHAGLLIRTVLSSGGSTAALTRLGWTALVQGTAGGYLSGPRPAPAAAALAQPAVHQGVPASVVALAQARNHSAAVQRLRELTGAQLREAEQAVNALTELR